MAANKCNIPKQELEILTRHFLTKIQAFFESKEERKEYKEWKAEQAALKAQTTDKRLKMHTRVESENSLPLLLFSS